MRLDKREKVGVMFVYLVWLWFSWPFLLLVPALSADEELEKCGPTTFSVFISKRLFVWGNWMEWLWNYSNDENERVDITSIGWMGWMGGRHISIWC